MTETPRRGRALLRLLVTTVLLPLCFLALGVWEWQRGAAYEEASAGQRLQAAKIVAILEARPAPAAGRPDYGAQFSRHGRNYAGPLAVSEAREALEDAELALTVARFRQYLPPIVMVCAGLAALLSIVTLLAAAALGRAGRGSRDTLVRGFSLAQRALPPLMGVQVTLAALVIVAATGFETSALLDADSFSATNAKALTVAAMVLGASLWTAGRAVFQLRRTVERFTPDPLSIMGRPVSRAEAPGLWRLLDGLATQLGALRPDNVVVGLAGGFFVTSGPKVLDPGGGTLEGRTLYLPLPYLPLLREDEVATIIGHELAHFSGGDTEYSLRFLPIYAGVERSLDTVALAGMRPDGSPSLLTRPVLQLGVFVVDQFHLAVMHWSRMREFAADAAGASVTSADASVRALLRTSAVEPRIVETLETAFRDPSTAAPDLVAATLNHAAKQGLDDPATHLEEVQPHPTDTHPPTRQRLAALGQEPTPELLAQAAAAPPADALARLGTYFAEPEALCQAATADFLAVAHTQAREIRRELVTAAAGVAEDALALHENTRAGAIFLFVFGGMLIAGVITLLALGVPGVGQREQHIVAGAGAALALVFALLAVMLWRRGDSPFVVLRPDSLLIGGLDRPISWQHIADLDMTLVHNSLLIRILLPPEAPFPARLWGGRRVKLDLKRRIVTFTATPSRKLKVQGFVDLIARYQQADAARRLLAEQAQPNPAAVIEA